MSTSKPPTGGTSEILTDDQDAFGHFLLDYLGGREGEAILERDDGYEDSTSHPVEHLTLFRGPLTCFLEEGGSR